MDDIHKSGIVTGLQNLLTSSEYSDLIIRTGSEEFKVHRAIICPRSKFFAAACKGSFQVCHINFGHWPILNINWINVFQEGKTGIITLQDDDTPTVHRMMKYLYTLDYDDEGEAASVATYGHGKGASGNLQAATVIEEDELSENNSSSYHKLLNNVAVYAIADKYDIPELGALAAKKFCTAIWDSMLVTDMASLRAIIDAVFEATPDAKRDLRDAVIWYCKDWNKGFIDNEDSAAILKDYGEIGLAIIRELFLKFEQKEKSMQAQIEKMVNRENTLLTYIERISHAANNMKVSNSREVQQNYIDAQHRRLSELRAAIQAAKDYSRRG